MQTVFTVVSNMLFVTCMYYLSLFFATIYLNYFNIVFTIIYFKHYYYIVISPYFSSLFLHFRVKSEQWANSTIFPFATTNLMYFFTVFIYIYIYIIELIKVFT